MSKNSTHCDFELFEDDQCVIISCFRTIPSKLSHANKQQFNKTLNRQFRRQAETLKFCHAVLRTVLRTRTTKARTSPKSLATLTMSSRARINLATPLNWHLVSRTVRESMFEFEPFANPVDLSRRTIDAPFPIGKPSNRRIADVNTNTFLACHVSFVSAPSSS